MSLDVSLYMPNDKFKAWEARKQESLSEAGSMVGLIPLINEYYEDRKPIERLEVYGGNITHNLGEMAKAAGIYMHLWRPEELKIQKAFELIKPLKDGIKVLKSHPEEFKKYNSPNGWGMYEHFVPFVEEYLKACYEYPDAEVYASR